MRQSQLFTKTRRESPKDEVAKNAQLLIRAGFIHKEMAGVYSYLPLGLRVLREIENIIREEMNAIGGQEILMTTLQDPDVWKKSGRWNSFENWFKTALSDGGESGLGFTHEEPLVAMMRGHVYSYRDLPRYAYQIQTKFRNEERAKSGLLRGREFLMKDLYSFSRTEAEHAAFYETAKTAYARIFDRVGIGDRTFVTFASGGSFSKYSHEFQTLSDVGEDTIYVDEEKRIAVNKEVYTDAVLRDLRLSRGSLAERAAIEVGNIFSLGTRFSEALGLTFRDESGIERYPVMGSYGVGLGRLMGAVVEVLSDEKGIVWPESIAPFRVHVLALSENDNEDAEKYVGILESQGISVLYDDRPVTAGEKFSDADLIGIPTRIVISEKTRATQVLEVKDRKSGVVSMMREQELMSRLTS